MKKSILALFSVMLLSTTSFARTLTITGSAVSSSTNGLKIVALKNAQNKCKEKGGNYLKNTLRVYSVRKLSSRFVIGKYRAICSNPSRAYYVKINKDYGRWLNKNEKIAEIAKIGRPKCKKMGKKLGKIYKVSEKRKYKNKKVITVQITGHYQCAG